MAMVLSMACSSNPCTRPSALTPTFTTSSAVTTAQHETALGKYTPLDTWNGMYCVTTGPLLFAAGMMEKDKWITNLH